MKILRPVLCCFLLAAPLVWGTEMTSPQMIADSLKGKIVFLRGMESGDRLNFDALGTEIGADATQGSFAYSAVKIEKARISGSELDVETKRIAMIFQTVTESPSLADIHFVPLKEPTSIVIAVDPQHPEELDAAVKKVFAFSAAEMFSTMPPAQETVALDSLGSAAPVPGGVVTIRSVSGSEQVIYHLKPGDWDARVIRSASGTKQVTYQAKPGEVTPPTLISSVPPVFTDEAKKKRLQGICILSAIVDTAGRPEHIRIARSLDPGLDVSAIVAVTQYRFEPGTYQGKAVLVLINIEVNFRIY